MHSRHQHTDLKFLPQVSGLPLSCNRGEMELFKGNPGLDDDIYMCGEADQTRSYSVVFRDEDAIADAEIVNRIRGTNWNLFAKLRGMPWTSAGEPLQAQDVDTDAPSEPVIDPAILYAEVCMRSPDQQNDPSSSSGTECTRLPRYPENTPGLVKGTITHLQTLQSRVIEAKIFSLHLHSDPNHTYRCSRLTCRRNSYSISVGDTFGSVADNQQKQDEPWIGINAVFYCLECLAQIIKEYRIVEKIPSRLPNGVDGTTDDGTTSDFRAEILEAAERLHPSLEQKKMWFMYFPREPPLDHGVDSNSSFGLRLRRQKQYEIERILRDTRVDRWHARVLNTSNTSDNLILTARPDLPPHREQYRKQGLEWADRSTTARDGVIVPVENAIDQEHVCSPDELTRSSTCFCREMSDHSPIVQCSSMFCMFGKIHLQCSGLGHIPLDDEQYRCPFCKEGMKGTMNSNNVTDTFQSQKVCTADDNLPTHEEGPINHNPEADSLSSKRVESSEKDQELGVIFREASSLVRKFVAVNDAPMWIDELPLNNVAYS
ncbi:hypothetical protein PV10_01178 [Exophiala mesophila]|uniref:Zinc finger PHD-type domain-containing protein n=1 Tax=Exophiala mesophila TaxID=212818 RepID=A0A0D1ZU20_EXOME|nr:uncharacterized protein PV10_01178 [Exophiala mesophila]KIV97424.1 hypothetical protein PV10_01178 [Exophiala mesophila]